MRGQKGVELRLNYFCRFSWIRIADKEMSGLAINFNFMQLQNFTICIVNGFSGFCNRKPKALMAGNN